MIDFPTRSLGYGFFAFIILFFWFVTFEPTTNTERLVFWGAVFLSPVVVMGFAHYGLVDELRDRHNEEAIKKNKEVFRSRAKTEEWRHEAVLLRSILEYYKQIDPTWEGKIPWLRSDPAIAWLSKEEYDSLPKSEAIDLALSRYWKNDHSLEELGKHYERYVGSKYEEKGWAVNYHGISNGMKDRGIDLICQRGDEIALVQCKGWSRKKAIPAKEINLFYGYTTHFKQKNPGTKNARLVFATTTRLLPDARRVAKDLGIRVFEADGFWRGSRSIKGGVFDNDIRRYYLPFDPQYDEVSVNPAMGGQRFTRAEQAEESGFYRPFLWQNHTGWED